MLYRYPTGISKAGRLGKGGGVNEDCPGLLWYHITRAADYITTSNTYCTCTSTTSGRGCSLVTTAIAMLRIPVTSILPLYLSRFSILLAIPLRHKREDSVSPSPKRSTPASLPICSGTGYVINGWRDNGEDATNIRFGIQILVYPRLKHLNRRIKFCMANCLCLSQARTKPRFKCSCGILV